MSFDQETTKKLLSQELLGGYHLNANLQALLGRPLDSRGQEEAMAVSRELSRVFAVSLFMLKPDNNRAEDVRAAPEIRSTDDSIGPTRTKDKCISSEDVTSKVLITPSPHSLDGYQWRKYGQKNIQKSNFRRNYYRCTFGRDRHCTAKKQVQQLQDNGSDPAMFQVTYVNEHTCQIAVSNEYSTISSPTSHHPEAVLDSTRNGSLLPYIGSAQENEAIVSCLATVISGTAPSSSSSSPPAEAHRSDPATYLAPASVSSSLDDSMADEMVMEMEMGFSYDQSFSPVGAAELINHCDVSMDAVRFMDPLWPQYT